MSAEHEARYYDKIYSFKDYRAEAEKIIRIAKERVQSGGNRLLDVACGTGRHIEYLKGSFEVEGLDMSEEMLEIARARNPGVAFHRGDMVDFELAERFDVITCLFSAIGYTKTLDRAGRAIGCMARHLLPGGVLLIEPWLTPENWKPGTVHAIFVDEPELKIARVNTSLATGRISYFDFHYLIGTPQGTTHFVSRHELGLFTKEEMEELFVNAGLMVEYDPDGLTGRGLFIGTRPR